MLLNIHKVILNVIKPLRIGLLPEVPNLNLLPVRNLRFSKGNEASVLPGNGKGAMGVSFIAPFPASLGRGSGGRMREGGRDSGFRG